MPVVVRQEKVIQGNHSRPLIAILKRMICDQRVKKRNSFFKGCRIGILTEGGLERPSDSRFQKSHVTHTCRPRRRCPWPKYRHQIVMNVLNVSGTQHADE